MARKLPASAGRWGASSKHGQHTHFHGLGPIGAQLAKQQHHSLK